MSTPPSLLSRVKFLLVQSVCVGVDAVICVLSLKILQRRTPATVSVVCTERMRRLFSLQKADRTPYPEPAYSGHIATVLCALRPAPSLPYERTIVAGGDGNPMCLDWAACPDKLADRLFVVVPGLSSSSGTNYIRHFVNYACGRGNHCCVFTSRGLGDTPLEQPRLMSAFWTEDLRAVVKVSFSSAALEKRFGRPMKVFAIGFSLGGVILSKYVGEESRDGKPLSFCAAFAVNSPIDVISANDVMNQLPNSILYQPSMTSGLIDATRRHGSLLSKIPGLAPHVRESIEQGRVEEIFKKIKTVYDYDTYFTAPANNFPDALAYYAEINPLKWLTYTSIPFLCISAADDPVCGPFPTKQVLAAMQTNENISVLFTPYGGHIGYVGSLRGEWNAKPLYVETLLCNLISHFDLCE